MIKLLGLFTLLMFAFYGAEQAGWLRPEQAQFVPDLRAAIPTGLRDALPNHDETAKPRSFTERVTSQQ